MFLTLLELGAQPVSIISKHVGLPRSSTYLLIDNLTKIGLIQQFERRGIKYVKCIPVSELHEVVASRERKLQQTHAIIDEYLPELAALESTLSVTPKARFFEGKESVEQMYDEIMRGSHFCAFANIDLVKEYMLDYYYELPKVIHEKGGAGRELIVESDIGREYQDEFSNRRHQIKLLPKEFTFKTDFIITKEQIYMTAYGDGQVSSIALFSTSIRETHQQLFDWMWERVDAS